MRRWKRTSSVLLCACTVAIAAPVLAAPQPDAPAPAVASDTMEPQTQRIYRATCEFGGKPAACEVRMSVSRVTATVADRIEILLEARVPEGVRVEWPEMPLAGAFNVLGGEDTGPVLLAPEGGGPRRVGVRRAVLLEPFLPGDREIGRMEVGLVSSAGESCVITTEPVKIEVASLIEGEPSEPGLRGVVEPEPERVAWWVWAVGGASVVALACAFALVLRRRKPREPEALTPYAAAMKRLAELEGSSETGDVSAYCAVLADTLRVFVAGTMGLPPADRTTEQLIAELGDQPAVNVTSLREVLVRLDEASFGGGAIPVGEAHELRDKVHKLIVGLQAMRTASESGEKKEAA